MKNNRIINIEIFKDNEMERQTSFKYDSLVNLGEQIQNEIYERYPKLDWLEMEHRGITVNDEWDYESYMDMTITQFCEKSRTVKELLVKQD